MRGSLTTSLRKLSCVIECTICRFFGVPFLLTLSLFYFYRSQGSSLSLLLASLLYFLLVNTLSSVLVLFHII